MRTTSAWLAVASLVLGTAPGWSQQAGLGPPPVVDGTVVSSWEVPPSANPPRPSLRQRLQDWVLPRPASRAVPAAVELGTPVSSAESLPAAITPTSFGSVPSAEMTPTPSLRQRFQQWLRPRPSPAAPAGLLQPVAMPRENVAPSLLQPTAMPAANSEAAPAEAEAAGPAAGTAQPTEGFIIPLPPAPAGAPCLSCARHRSCWEQLDDWLTYRPLSSECHNCFLKPYPCCEPPLYAFFIGGCCVTPAPAHAPCAPGSCGGGQRLTGFWDGVKSRCTAPARGEPSRIWLNLSNLHLWPCKSSAATEMTIVEKPD